MHGLIFQSVISVLLLGVILLAFVYHIVLYYYNRDRLFLHYLVYLTFTGLFVFQRSGFLFYWLEPEIELKLYDFLNEPIQILYLATYFNFILQSLDITKSTHRFLYWSKAFIRIILVGYALGFILIKTFFPFEDYALAFTLIRIFIFLLTFIMLWECFKLRHITFQLFILIGSACYFVFGIVSFISNLNASDTQWIYPPEWLMIGSFTDIVFFSIALSHRNKQQWEKMNLALLEDANEIIAMQKLVLEKQAALENERNRIALDMHDDLGSGLTKINYLSQMALMKMDYEESLKKIHQTSSDLVKNMSEIIWALNEDNDRLEDLCSFIKNYSNDYLENNSIDLTIQIDINNPTLNVIGNHRRSIFLLVKEALHNVVKHAQASSVIIYIHQSESLLLTIHDNGIGFQVPKSSILNNGLRNMEKRVQKLNGTFQIENDQGTKITLCIPVAHLN
ncbi:Signal transduction histidine kinase [Flavobacterium fontis]|uniref:Signal transduction histidine kinase n=1 Tax=Flavobacterium fontis TaxID=1124188 RepID=A0A1M4Z548_9FLAO|nr:7TM diverse intracellular signaling domain-containing protein [Flavobacterium fontis]SHF13161.1 Signal transduction histidine kinase [Flavobacterium fontis]